MLSEARMGPKSGTVVRQTAPQGGKEPAGALVLGGDHRALGIARSLGRRQIPVWVLHSEGDRLAASSRYAKRHLPWPEAPAPQQIQYLVELADEFDLDGWTLFATGDETAALISRYRCALGERFHVAAPEWESMAWAYDKRLTYRLAADTGVALPRTSCPANLEELQVSRPNFPCILKPAIKKETNPFTRDKAWMADSPASLQDRYIEACKYLDPELILLQELIPGGGETQFSYVALCSEGEPLAWIAARRTRQYPVDFGHSSSLVETVERPEIEAPARRLLAAMRYTGVVEVEFKYDSRDGQYKLLDINPRFWTWHSLCSRAGIDFPYLLWRLTRGEEILPQCARTGVRWMRLETDVLSSAKQLLGGSMSLRGYFQSLRGPIEFATFAGDDPLPALMDLPLAAWRRLFPAKVQ